MTEQEIHQFRLIRQYAGACLPDLEYLERELRSEGKNYLADCLKSRQTMLKSAIAETHKVTA